MTDGVSPTNTATRLAEGDSGARAAGANLREIDEGTYGICQSCESLIRKQRLLALPFARNCLDCQAAQERRRLGHAAAPAPRRFVP